MEAERRTGEMNASCEQERLRQKVEHGPNNAQTSNKVSVGLKSESDFSTRPNDQQRASPFVSFPDKTFVSFVSFVFNLYVSTDCLSLLVNSRSHSQRKHPGAVWTHKRLQKPFTVGLFSST